MTDTTSTAEDRALDALTKILESAISPEMLHVQQLILRRLALSGDLFPSRVPAPLNITQIGGYLNLIENDPVMRSQVLASTLGVAGPNPSPGYDPTLPPLYFVAQPNHRPVGAPQAATPVEFRVRNDFAGPLTAALATLHDSGFALPVLAADAPLPPVFPGVAPPSDLLPYLGRVLELVPTAALVDPTTDPLAVGQLAGTGPQVVVARQVDATAPSAGTPTAAAYALWSCTATACTQASVTDKFVAIAPLLSGAGWTQANPLPAPVSAADTKGWNRFVNGTGLVAGRTTFGDELRLLYSLGQIAASSVRERQDWVWDGTAFAAPA